MAGNLGTLSLDLVTRIGQFVEPLNKAERKARESANSMSKQFDVVTNSIKNQQTELDRTANALGFFATSTKALLGGFTVSKAVEMADGYGQMAAQIEIATKQTGQYQYVQDRLLKTANTTYRPLKEAQQVWLDVGGALEKVGYTAEQTLNITDSMSFAFTANATAADKATSATNAVTNSIIKNKVEADAWSSIMAAIPTITADLAKQMNKSEGEVLKLGATGKLSAKELALAFENSRDKNEELANSMRNSVKDGWTRLENAATVYIGKLNEASDGTNTFAAILSGMGENIEVLANAGIAVGIGYATVALRAKTVALKDSVVASLEERATTVAQAQAEQLANEITAQRTARILHLTEVELINAQAQAARLSGIQKLTFVESTLIPLQQAHAKALTVDTIAQEANNKSRLTGAAIGRSLIGALTGPIGLGVSVAAVAAGYLLMRDSGDKANDMLKDQKRYAELSTNELNNLDGAQRRAAGEELSKALHDQSQKLAVAKKDFELLVESVLDSNKTNKEAYRIWAELRTGTIEASEAFSRLNKTNFVTPDQINRLTDGKKKVDELKKGSDELEKKTKDLTKTQEASAKAVKSQADAYKDLSESQQKVIDKINNDAWGKDYIRRTMAQGWSREEAEYYLGRRNEGDFDKTKPLDPYTNKKFRDDFNSKYYTFSDSDRKKMATALALSAKYSFENLAKNKGLPSGFLTGLITQESGGRNLRSPTGAQGFGQTTSAFRKTYGLTVDDNTKNPTKVAAAMVDDLSKSFKEFGSWFYAAMAYNGGVAGTKAFKEGRISNKVTAKGGSQLINGQLYLSPDKAKEMEKHANQVLKYTAGINRSTKVDDSLTMPSTEDILKLENEAVLAKNALQDAKDAFEKQLATPLKQMDLENAETIKKLQETYADDPKKLQEMLGKNDVLYQANRNKLIAEKENEFNQYFSFEKDRITQITESYDHEIKLVMQNTDFSIEERKRMAEAKEREKQSEIASLKLEQKEQILSANEAYMSETAVMLHRYEIEREQIKINKGLRSDIKDQILEANQRAVGQVLDGNNQKIEDIQYQSLDYLFRKNEPNRAEFIDLENQRVGANRNLDKAYSEQREGLFLAVDDENELNAKLLEAHDRYLQTKAALDDEYAERNKDLRNQTLVDNLSTQSSMYGSLAEMLKDAGQEQTGIYRAMFATEKAFAIASAAVQIPDAMSKALNTPFPANLAAMASVAALGATIVSNITAVTGGFAEGGYTGHGGKYDPAGIVHKGEGVLTQEEIAALGGPAGFEYLRRAIRTGDLFENSEILASKSFMDLAGYSSGGIVGGDVSLSGALANKKLHLSSDSSLEINSTNKAPTVNVYTLPGETADVNWNNGELDVRIRKVSEQHLASQLRNPNSTPSKAIKQNFNTTQKR